jgi:hypothetical protein
MFPRAKGLLQALHYGMRQFCCIIPARLDCVGGHFPVRAIAFVITFKPFQLHHF